MLERNLGKGHILLDDQRARSKEAVPASAKKDTKVGEGITIKRQAEANDHTIQSKMTHHPCHNRQFNLHKIEFSLVFPLFIYLFIF